MSRPRATFPLSPGIGFPVTRPGRQRDNVVEYEATLGDFRRWLGLEDVEAPSVAPLDAGYVVVASSGVLTGERVITAGAGVNLAIGAATVTVSVSGKLDQWVWDDFGSDTGVTHTLSQTPSNANYMDVFLTGFRLRKVGAAPGPGEYTVSGTTLTLGLAKAAADSLVVTYPYTAATYQVFQYDDLTGTASSSFTLTQTPNDPGEIDVFLTGMRLRYTAGAPSPIEFTVSGTSGTLGLTRSATDSLIARYVVAP